MTPQKWYSIAVGLAACLACSVAVAQHSAGHGVHPPMPDAKLFVHARAAEAPSLSAFVDVPLKIRSASSSQELAQAITLSDPPVAIRAVRYLPSGALRQDVSSDESGKSPPAIEVSIEGPSQSFRRWLLADDPERNRLISYIGTWRFMVVPDPGERDTLFKQFETELTRTPSVRIIAAGGDSWRELPLEVGQLQSIPELNCTMQVREFFTDYAMDRTALTPSNQSDRKKNPAAFVEIEYEGVKEARWVFAKFPDFTPAGGQSLPFRIVLDCPIEAGANTPDFAVVYVAGGGHEVWTRASGKTTATAAQADEKINIPGSQYAFRLLRTLASARLTESYTEAAPGKGSAAVEFEYPSADGIAARVWLGMGQFRRIATSQGALLLGFDDRAGPQTSAHP